MTGPGAPSVCLTTTVTFGEVGEVPLLADLYLPEGAGLHPLVVAVSGGGWIRGTRGALSAWGSLLAGQGLAVASIDYRRATDGPAFPGNAEDVSAALTYFTRHGDRHGIDARRMALLGVSAGAHLGALVMLNEAFHAPRVRAFAGIYGVYDLVAHWQADAASPAEPGTDKTERMMGVRLSDAPGRYLDASPIRHITADQSLPIYLAWGHLDRDVSPEQSICFARALRQAGYPVTVTELPDAGHLWFSQDDPREPGTHSACVAPTLVRFLVEALGAQR
jgi:acetyl esterase/lipase